MRKLVLISTVLFFSLFLAGCSWICELFIVNPTDKPIEIEITLLKNPEGIPIFYYPSDYWNSAKTYPCDGSLSVDYNKITETTLNKLSSFSYIIKVPAKSTIEIGSLHNDYYKKYNQQFINGRVFNLTEMKVFRQKDTLKIHPETFDNYTTIGKHKNVYFTVSQ